MSERIEELRQRYFLAKRERLTTEVALEMGVARQTLRRFERSEAVAHATEDAIERWVEQQEAKPPRRVLTAG